MTHGGGPINRTCPDCDGRGAVPAGDFGGVTRCSGCLGTRFVQAEPSDLGGKLIAARSWADLLARLADAEADARRVGKAAEVLGETRAVDCCAVEAEVLACVRAGIAAQLAYRMRLTA